MLGSDSSNLVVLLASVLKPVDDTRMWEKFAETLRHMPNTVVHVAGRATAPSLSSRRPMAAPPVQQHAIFAGSRLSLDRLAAQWRYWRLLRHLRPQVVFVHAPELLPLTMLWQWLGRGRQFVYDIRENYALNITTQGVYQGVMRSTLARLLRGIETLAARRAAAFILAEESYADELPFLRQLPTGRVLILENKYQPDATQTMRTEPAPPSSTAPLRLLFSGTISVLNGIHEAIALTQALQAQRPGGAHLTIIGFCQQPGLLAEVQRTAMANPTWLRLVGGGRPVPHAAIVAAIRKADFGLLPYQPHPSTARCRPTKLFEYLAHGLPVLIPDNPLWTTLVQRYQAGLVVGFGQPTQAAAIVTTAQTRFYPQGVPVEVFWESEAKKLRHLLKSLG